MLRAATVETHTEIALISPRTQAHQNLHDLTTGEVTKSPPFHPSSFILHPSSFILHPSSFILYTSKYSSNASRITCGSGSMPVQSRKPITP